MPGFDPQPRRVTDDRFAHLVTSGHPDGFCLRFGDEVVVTSPDFEGVQASFKAGKEALAMLAACLATAPGRENA